MKRFLIALLIFSLACVAYALGDQIPLALWAAALGALFSILGIALTNAASDRRQSAQFQNEWKLKSDEREMARRWEIYLEMAATIHIALISLSKVVDVDIQHSEVMAEFNSRSPVFAKANVVGDLELCKLMVGFNTEAAISVSKCFAHRMIVMNLKGEITMHQKFRDEALQKQTYWVEKMTEYNLAGNKDTPYFGFLEKNFGTQQNIFNKHSAEVENVTNAFLQEFLKLTELCMTEVARLNLLTPPILEKIKGALHIEGFDVGVFTDLIETANKKNLETIKELTSSLKSQANP